MYHVLVCACMYILHTLVWKSILGICTSRLSIENAWSAIIRGYTWQLHAFSHAQRSIPVTKWSPKTTAGASYIHSPSSRAPKENSEVSFNRMNFQNKCWCPWKSERHILPLLGDGTQWAFKVKLDKDSSLVADQHKQRTSGQGVFVWS